MSPFLYVVRNDAKEFQRQLLWPRATFPLDSFVRVTRWCGGSPELVPAQQPVRLRRCANEPDRTRNHSSS